MNDGQIVAVRSGKQQYRLIGNGMPATLMAVASPDRSGYEKLMTSTDSTAPAPDL